MKNLLVVALFGLLLSTTGCAGDFWTHRWPWEGGGCASCGHGGGKGDCQTCGKDGHAGHGDQCGCPSCENARHHGRGAGSAGGPGGPGGDEGGFAGGPPTGAVAYPYYTTRGPRDFLNGNPPSIGPQ